MNSKTIRVLIVDADPGEGDDLRTDGLHGFLAPEVLGFRARPITL